MCGIVGFINSQESKETARIIFEGLLNLEYRGYDSWGVAVKKERRFRVQKKVGKIGTSQVNLPKSNLGIGHTRWATHGGVTVANAHPHLDCTGELAVAHNGIIENFQEIKADLLAKNHKFRSETDTEVVVHLIEENLKIKGFTSAVRDAFVRLKGLNAIIVAYTKSTEIIAAKNGSPLIVGVGDNKFFIASDLAGIAKYCQKVVFLEDNQMAVLGRELQILSLPAGKRVTPKYHRVDYQIKQESKGSFPHYLLKEIVEQPQVIKNIASDSQEDAVKLAELINKAFGTFMLGCGSAAYAAQAGIYLFSKVAKKHVNFSIGSELGYNEHYLKPKSLVIPISQSGETIDIIDAVHKLKRRGAKIVAITNVFASTLYRQSDYQFLLKAGPEKAVLATKSLTAMFSLLFYTSYSLVKKQAEGKKLLIAAANDIKEILKEKNLNDIEELAKKLVNKAHIFIIGRGLSYPLALEGALKSKEASYIHAEGFAGGELKHGPIALIGKGTPCIVIAPNDETYDDIIGNAREVSARGGYIIGIGPRKSEIFDLYLKTKDLREATFLPQIVICQLLAYYLTVLKGYDPDKPRNLAKSVTVK